MQESYFDDIFSEARTEVERLTNLNNGEPISLIHNLTFNRMFQYFAFNVAMCYSIYITMGYKSLAW